MVIHLLNALLRVVNGVPVTSISQSNFIACIGASAPGRNCPCGRE